MNCRSLSWSLKALSIALLVAAQATAAPAAGVHWSTAGMAAARAEAQRTNKLVMIDFYTDWCTYCKVLEGQVYPDPGVSKALEQFVPVRLNAEKEGEALARQYKVDGYPTMVFVDGAGAMIEKIGGVEPAAALTEDLNRIADDQREFPVLQAQVKGDPSNTGAGIKLAVALLRRGRASEARSLITSIQGRGPGAQAQLGPAYDLMGDHYLGSDDVVSATPWYQKSLAHAGTPTAASVAHLKLAICYIVQNRVKDGKAELQAILNTPDAPAGVKARSREILQQLPQLQKKHNG